MRRENADNNDAFFGNKLMLFGGDFRQILPVVPKGNRDAIVKASLKNTRFWKFVRLHKLTENMRIKSAAINQGVSADKINEFSKLLLNIRDGYAPYLNNSRYLDDIQLPTVLAKKYIRTRTD